jgi:hypothetical protein
MRVAGLTGQQLLRFQTTRLLSGSTPSARAEALDRLAGAEILQRMPDLRAR